MFPGWAAYGAAKAGLDAYVRYLAAEAGDDVTAFSFVPGLTNTAMQAGLREVLVLAGDARLVVDQRHPAPFRSFAATIALLHVILF